MTDKTEEARKFQLGDRVTKTKGSNWTGRVVGFYSTSLTPIGYAVESETEKGSVQIYPEQALRAHDQAAPVEDPELCYHTDVARPTFEGDEAKVRKNLARIGKVTDTSHDWAYAADALALLDAKDAEIARFAEANDTQAGWYVEALAAKERAEQALAERDAAIVEAVRRAGPDAIAFDYVIGPLRPFLPDPEPVSDPLVAVLREEVSGHGGLHEELAVRIRAALAARGGKVVFGEVGE